MGSFLIGESAKQLHTITSIVSTHPELHACLYKHIGVIIPRIRVTLGLVKVIQRIRMESVSSGVC